MRQKLAKQAESSGLGRIVSQPQSDLYIMFLLCEMFQHKFGCFIQNHPFHRRQVLCWRYVRQNRQVCSGEAGGAVSQSATIRETTANKVTKHVVPAFLHSLSDEGSEMVLNIVFIGLPKYFSVLHLWNELYWQPVSPLFVIVFEIFSVSK